LGKAGGILAMKLFFMSDIHGSLHYLKIALDRFKLENAQYLVILGDELYHGARNPLPPEYNPKEVAGLLNGFADRIVAVRGNCDSEVDEMVLDFPIMSTYSNLLYNNRRLFLTHGHVYNESNLPPLCAGDVFVYGHTHIPVAEKREDIYIVNPGSITFPKEDNPNTYAVLEDSVFIIKELDGSVFKEIKLT
jgi:putative phosphoesterase